MGLISPSFTFSFVTLGKEAQLRSASFTLGLKLHRFAQTCGSRFVLALSLFLTLQFIEDLLRFCGKKVANDSKIPPKVEAIARTSWRLAKTSDL